jgi:hypothetical protein
MSAIDTIGSVCCKEECEGSEFQCACVECEKEEE